MLKHRALCAFTRITLQVYLRKMLELGNVFNAHSHKKKRANKVDAKAKKIGFTSSNGRLHQMSFDRVKENKNKRIYMEMWPGIVGSTVPG